MGWLPFLCKHSGHYDEMGNKVPTTKMCSGCYTGLMWRVRPAPKADNGEAATERVLGLIKLPAGGE